MKKRGTCTNCRREMLIHAKQMCFNCYRKFAWKPKLIKCPRCKRIMPLHAKGLCPGCYQSVFHLENNKNYNHQKRHKISIELYKKITKSCMVCGFNKFVELHHVDCNRHNNRVDNMVGLCPNHHKMLHTLKYGKFLKELVERLIIMKKYQTTLATQSPTDRPITLLIRKENSPVLMAAN